MTEKLGRGDRQRGVARITLVVLALVQAVILMATLSDGLLALAQPGPSSSPTARSSTSASPRQSPSQEPSPTGPTIQWLNPSKYEPEQVISDKQDDDQTYHLVAWVGNRPPGAVVQFTYQGTQGSPNEVTICTANQVPGTNDTWECDWDLDDTGTGNGSYELRAILYSSSASPGTPSPGATPPFEVDRDEEVVEVRREAETVEIEYPVNGGPLGVYEPPGPQRAGFVMDVQTSEDAGEVRAYYSESPPGTEPSWQNCQETTTVFFSDGTRRIGCVLQQGDTTSTSITAVAAVPIREATPDLPPGLECTPELPATNCPGDPGGAESGDAHRVFSYAQDPAVVELPPPSENRPNQQGNFTCQVLTSAVRDQNGRPIWRVNMDVHAAGPGDEVRFGTVSGRTDRFKAPDQGGHQTENTDTCANAPAEQSSPAQGRHTNVSGPDPKHIESVDGSDTSGLFTFAVRSPSREGTSTVTAWADEDDNDDRQATEPFDTTTVNFTRQTASPSGSSTSPSQSASTATATATETATATQSATTPSQSASTSASQTSPSSGPPAQSLNCEPETDTNPVGSSHTFVCTVNQGSAPASGVSVDVEASGANDTDGDSRNSPDFTCTTTGEGGSCTITHGPGGFGSTADTGTTVYRAWIDADDNDQTIEADPTEGVNEFGQPGQRGEPDNTDVIEKTWQRAPLDCTPEQDGNPTGSPHTITCRAAQAGGGAPPQGTHIVAEAVGANDPDSGETYETPDFECRTNQEGVCNFTHGPGGNGTTNFEGVTRYRAWIDQDNANSTVEADRTEGRDEVAEPGGQQESDNTDVVEKTWTRTPQSLTMEPDSDSASVGSCNAFTITVLGDDGRAVSGLLIDLEQRHERANNQANDDEPRVFFCTPRAGDGPNPSAVDQTQGDLDPPDESPDNPGTAGGETLTQTDQNGRVTVGIGIEPANGSDGSGTVNLVAFFETDDDNDPEPGEPQDSSTKTWVPQEGRTITCLPETDTNPANTQHVVTCTVRDRFGAPVEGEGVTFTEDGTGDFTSRGARTDANGEVRAVTTSSTAGAQTVTATLDRDLQGAEPGEVDECDRPAGTPANAPAGACSDSVSKTWTAATTASPAQFSREVTIEAQRSRVLYNRNVTLSGAVTSDAAAPSTCTQFVEVNILRDVVGGASEFELFATEQTDANGTFSHSFRADLSANYVAEVEELAQCEAATSEPEPVLVKVKVSLRVSDSKVPRGTRVRFTVTTAPCPATARDRVLLFRAIEGEFGKVGSKRTNARCVKSFRRAVRSDSVFQARWPKQADEFLAGRSRSKVVRVQNRRR